MKDDLSKSIKGLLIDASMVGIVERWKDQAMHAFVAANREAYNAWVREVGKTPIENHFVKLRDELAKKAREHPDADLRVIASLSRMIETLGSELELSEQEARDGLKSFNRIGEHHHG